MINKNIPNSNSKFIINSSDLRAAKSAYLFLLKYPVNTIAKLNKADKIIEYIRLYSISNSNIFNPQAEFTQNV